MSANRSVQAAQRRRAGPPEPAAPGRGPQPSINSAQMFANQHRSGPGPNIPSGKLAGQHAALAQKNMMSQKSHEQDYYQDPQSNLGSISKMTIAQAITLITLRLGKVETLLINGSVSMGHNQHDNDDETEFIHSLISRIDALEKKQDTNVTTASGSNVSTNVSANHIQDIALLKQQFETLKPIVIQTKNLSVSLKKQMDDLKSELTETKDIIASLQNIIMNNSTKLEALTSIFNPDNSTSASILDDLDTSMIADTTFLCEPETETLTINDDDNFDQNEFVGTNLKELIEQEFNAEA